MTGGVINTAATLSSFIVPAQLPLRAQHRGPHARQPETSLDSYPLHADPGASVSLGAAGLVNPQLGGAPDWHSRRGATCLVGGRFESELADGQGTGDTHWILSQCDANTDVDQQHGRDASAAVRLVVLGSLRRARFTDPDLPSSDLRRERKPARPARGLLRSLEARSSISRLRFKIKITLYHFDDTNPTEDPESDDVGEVDLSMNMPVERQLRRCLGRDPVEPSRRQSTWQLALRSRHVAASPTSRPLGRRPDRYRRMARSFEDA